MIYKTTITILLLALSYMLFMIGRAYYYIECPYQEPVIVEKEVPVNVLVDQSICYAKCNQYFPACGKPRTITVTEEVEKITEIPCNDAYKNLYCAEFPDTPGCN